MQTENNIMYTEDETSPWYALRLFSLKQQAINDELKRKGFTTFIPMETVDVIDRDNKLHHELRPVVHNLIFVRKAMEESEFQKVLIAMHYKLSVIKKGRDSKEMAEIPAKEMHEFQLMCDPKLAEKKYTAEESAKFKTGTTVLVTHGPLKGLTGKLIRTNKKYYLLKDVPGIAVMLKVTRWCCQPLNNKT